MLTCRWKLESYLTEDGDEVRLQPGIEGLEADGREPINELAGLGV